MKISVNRFKKMEDSGESTKAENSQAVESTVDVIPTLASSGGSPKEAVNNTENGGRTPLESANSQWSFDKILYYALIFLAPLFFLPFALSSIVESKKLLVGTLLLILLIYLLARFLANGKIELPKSMGFYAVTALFLAVLVSAIFSQARDVSFLGNSPDSLFWIVMYALGFIVGSVVLRGKKPIVIAALAYIFSMGILALFGLLQFSGVRILPFDFAQANSFTTIGSVFAVGFIVAGAFSALLSFLITTELKNKKWKIGLWALTGLFALFILQMNLWTIWLALGLTFVVISVVIGYGSIQNKEINFRPLLIPFFVVIISLLGLFIISTPSFIDIPLEVSPSFGTTVNITKDTLSGTRLIYGTGPGTFANNYSLHRPLSINETQFWGTQFNQGQSSFLTNVSTLGILGAATMLFVLFIFYKTLLLGFVRNNKHGTIMRSIVLGAFALTVFLGISTFLYRGNVVIYLLLFMAAGVGIAALYNMGVVKKFQLNLTGSPLIALASAFGVVLTISVAIGTVYFLTQNYLAQTYAGQAVAEFRADGNIDSALAKLDRAIKTNSKDDAILRVSSQALMVKASNIANDPDLTQEERSAIFTNSFQNAVTAAQLATQINPKAVQNWVQLGSVYEQVVGVAEGAEDLAVAAYERARELDPFNPSLPWAQARVYVTFSDVLQNRLAAAGALDQPDVARNRVLALGRAVDKLNDSIELKADYSTARFLLAATYQRLGNLGAAVAEAEQVVAQTPRDANVRFQLGLLYYEAQNFEAARVTFERALTLSNGVYGNARYYLGLTLDKLGDRVGAIAQFETVLADNPGNTLVIGILRNLRAGRDSLAGLETPGASAPLPDTGGAEQPVLP